MLAAFGIRKKFGVSSTQGDLSRLGRNQLHTGLYIEEIFPSNDVRYIAVNDNVDTKYENSNELMPFKNFFKNISHSGKVSNDFSLFGRF